MDNQLKELHATLQEILDYTVEVCEKNKLTYFLAYGSALGAYRHKGFIPWDDDLDIAMPREDYNKLIEIMNKNPSDLYVIQNEDNEDGYFLPFAKVRKKNTIFLESATEHRFQENGVFLDIFPLDYAEEKDSLKIKWTSLLISYKRHALSFISCKQVYRRKLGLLRYIVDYCLCAPVTIIGKKRVLKSLHLNAKSNGSPASPYVVQYDQVTEKAFLKREVYFPAQKMEFESKFYNVPNKICEYLSSQYGDDYMQLPPVEKRQNHNPAQLKL